MKVYTKTGDTGTTAVIGGKRVSKCDSHLEVYGTLDELDSFIGLLKNEPVGVELFEELTKIQHIIANINCCFACLDSTTEKKFSFEASNLQWIESRIDTYCLTLPQITDFLIPGSNKKNALANVCRTICRRAERQIYKIELLENQKKAAIFINRLSDYFFVIGRVFEQ